MVECYGNTCRSPMIAKLVAQALLEAKDELYIVHSAGYGTDVTFPQPAAPEWLALADDTGIDLSQHQSSFIGDYKPEVLLGFDRFVCVDAKAEASLLERGVAQEKILVIDVPNPWKEGRPLEEGIPVYREAFKNYVAEVIPAIMAWL
jgi:protein-tyrosine-phosphatase